MFPAMARQHFLVKSEPYKYPYAQLERDGNTMWDGVRNYEARNNLRAMKQKDLVLYYHSNEGKEIVGIAEVAKTAYPDPTADPDDADWSVVDLAPVAALPKPVSLEAVRKERRLQDIALVKKSRISVVPITEEEFSCVLSMGGLRSVPRKTRTPK